MADRAYYTADDVRQMMRDCIGEHGTQTALAEHLGVGKMYISDVLTGKSPPSDTIAAAFGLERVVMFRKRGKP